MCVGICISNKSPDGTAASLESPFQNRCLQLLQKITVLVYSKPVSTPFLWTFFMDPEGFEFFFFFSCDLRLMAQTVKRLSTMQETWVPFLVLKDSLEKEMATHSSTLAQKIPWAEKPGVHGVAKSWTRLSDFTSQLLWLNCAPPPKYFEVLASSTCEHDLIWKQGLYR